MRARLSADMRKLDFVSRFLQPLIHEINRILKAYDQPD